LLERSRGCTQAAFDVLAGLEVLQRDLALLLLVGFHFVGPFLLVWFSELLLAPNKDRLPPVTAFLGIRSSNLMHKDFLGPGLFGAEDLPIFF
jgi:hypothetical protein